MCSSAAGVVRTPALTSAGPQARKNRLDRRRRPRLRVRPRTLEGHVERRPLGRVEIIALVGQHDTL